MTDDKHPDLPRQHSHVVPGAAETAWADNLWVLSEMQLTQERDLQFRIQNGLLLSAEEFCAALGIDEAGIEEGLEKGNFIVVMVESGREYYPLFLTLSHFLPFGALRAVIAAMVGVSDIEKYYFLTSPSHYLRKKTPLAALTDGQLDNVLVAARALAER